MKALRMWWEEKKYKWALRIIKGHGFSVVKIVTRGNTNYFQGNDGQLYSVGRNKK